MSERIEWGPVCPPTAKQIEAIRLLRARKHLIFSLCPPSYFSSRDPCYAATKRRIVFDTHGTATSVFVGGNGKVFCGGCWGTAGTCKWGVNSLCLSLPLFLFLPLFPVHIFLFVLLLLTVFFLLSQSPSLSYSLFNLLLLIFIVKRQRVVNWLILESVMFSIQTQVTMTRNANLFFVWLNDRNTM